MVESNNPPPTSPLLGTPASQMGHRGGLEHGRWELSPLWVQIPALPLSSWVVRGREHLLGFLMASVSPPVKWA